LKSSAIEILTQIETCVLQIKSKDYSAPLSVLMHNSIGKHVRHILDLFDGLIQNADQEFISYDNRKRDLNIEISTDVTIQKIREIKAEIEQLDLDKLIQLKQKTVNETHTIQTSIQRELLYNIEHAIHHMAMIRIGLEQSVDYVQIPQNFGIAYSTIDYHAKA